MQLRTWIRISLPVWLLWLAAPGAAQLPGSSLRVRAEGRPVTWWRSEAAPEAWAAADPAVLAAVRWERLRPGLELGTLELSVNRGLLPLRIVIARVLPEEFDVALERRVENGRAAWRISDAPEDAALALNAGQFAEAGPWGWLVLGGRTVQAPAAGPLSAALAWSEGSPEWLDAPELEAAFRRRWRFAFQSYPVLLRDGRVPGALQAPERGVDVAHRDTRLALGLAGDTLLVVLTRYGAGGRLLARLPAGLTAPETAALMGALGARDAVMLDGGLSAQLLARGADGTVHAWPGARRVPLALVLRPRAERTRER